MKILAIDSSGAVASAAVLEDGVLRAEYTVNNGLTHSQTLLPMLDILKKRGPASLALCSLLDKPSRRTVPVNIDYCGFEIPDEFVVGYGLDYDSRYRNLPYIGVLKPEVYTK